MSDSKDQDLNPASWRDLRWRIQESLDGELDPSELAELTELRQQSPELDAIAQGFESLHAALARPAPEPPLTLHSLIMARIEAFRQREALYQRSSLLLLLAAGLGLAWVYGQNLNDFGLSLTLLSWELILAASDLFANFTSLLAWPALIPGEADLPLASLVLVPLFLALNALALPRVESLASGAPLRRHAS